jgi:hypothetical protein
MRMALDKRFMRAVGGFLAAAGAIALFIGYLSVPWPVAAGVLVISVGVGFWSYRGGPHGSLPSIQEVAVVVLLAAVVVLAGALLQASADPDEYDFVVYPKNGLAFPSAAPGPHHEISTDDYSYGDQVTVTCYVEASDGLRWFRLAAGRYLSEEDTAPDDAEDDEPPEC